MPRLIDSPDGPLQISQYGLVLPDWPRGLREGLAAAYVGLSVSTINTERRAGRFPEPVALTVGRVVYLREDLDRYLDRAAGRVVESTIPDWMSAGPPDVVR